MGIIVRVTARAPGVSSEEAPFRLYPIVERALRAPCPKLQPLCDTCVAPLLREVVARMDAEVRRVIAKSVLVKVIVVSCNVHTHVLAA